jgi:hypothetical protein
MTDGMNEEVLSITDEDIVEEYEDEGVQKVVMAIRRFKGARN